MNEQIQETISNVAEATQKSTFDGKSFGLGAAVGAGLTALGFLGKKIVSGVMAGTKKIQGKVEDIKASKEEKKTEKK